MSAGGGKLRLFVAIGVPEDIQARLATVQRELREGLGHSSVSWTRPENIHLTLRFLGDVPTNRIDELAAALAATAGPQAPLSLALSGLGCFPNSRRPRVLWAGVCDEAGELSDFARRIANATGSFSSRPAEERFAGHLTLARVRRVSGDGSSVIDRFIRETSTRALGSWCAGTVELVRSELHSVGSRYTTLARLRLAGLNG